MNVGISVCRDNDLGRHQLDLELDELYSVPDLRYPFRVSEIGFQSENGNCRMKVYIE